MRNKKLFIGVGGAGSIMADKAMKSETGTCPCVPLNFHNPCRTALISA